jgi:hypothetical protein
MQAALIYFKVLIKTTSRISLPCVNANVLPSRDQPYE